MIDFEAPRAGTVSDDAAFYESHYLKAVDPAGRRAVWIHCTAGKAPGARPRGTVWCTWFDADRDAPGAWRRTVADPLERPPTGTWWRHDDTELRPGRASGGVEDVRWDLRWTSEAGPVPYLPSPRLYDRRVPRSNGVALTPSARFVGTLHLGDATVQLDGWRGMVGHNWGSEHAEHWVWLHADGLPDGGWLDCALARVRVGPLLTPWLATGAICVDDRVVPLGGLRRLRRVDVRTTPDRAVLRVPAGDGDLVVEAELPASRTVAWDYDSPDGHGRDVRNCSIADARLELAGRRLELRGTLAVELGGPAAGAGAVAPPARSSGPAGSS